MSAEYTETFAQPLKFGHVLEIVAKSTAKADRFFIDLCTTKSAKNPNCDVGLNIKCDFKKDIISRNARISGIWGKSEKYMSPMETSSNPIVRARFFKIYILCGEDKFHISINNRPFCTFTYRMPIEMLRVIEIQDQIDCVKQVDHRTIFPNPWPIYVGDYFRDSKSHDDSIFTRSFINNIPIPFSAGHLIVITAICHGSSHGQFAIDFLDVDHIARIFLHFNPRFGERKVVRGTVQQTHDYRKGWGESDRDGGFPFLLNKKFKLAIAFTEKQYHAAINGNKFCSFVYREPNIFHKLVGFKATNRYGVDINISNVDHVHMVDPHCAGFEKYSRLDFD